MQDIIKKLKFKDTAVVINAPSPLDKEFERLGYSAILKKNIKSSNTLVFVNSKKDFTSFLTTDLKKLEPDSLLWFAYAKGTSKIKSDINRDILREIGEEFGITTVTAISIDDTWSALRFRPIDQVGK